MKVRTLISLILPVILLTACNLIYDAPGSGECPELSVLVEFPMNEVMDSKADVGEVPASLDENAIYDLAIWVFRATGEHKAVVEPLFVDNDNSSDLPSAGGVRKYALPIKDREFLLNRTPVDVFVLVNRQSIASSLTKESTWDKVKGAVFGGDALFSPKVPITEVPSKGLPMSGASMGVDVTGEEPFLKVPTVSVARAVSKLRYVFSQMKTEDGEEEFSIQEVVLLGGQIPMEEYVFPTQSSPYHIKENNYVSANMVTTWPANTPLAACDAPEIYSYAGQDGPSYEKLIQDGISAGDITHVGTYYLRESDKALRGEVKYTVKTGNIVETKTLPFSMAAPGDFARNHTWTLYGFFISDRTLLLSTSVAPWDKNNYTINFATSSLMVTRKFFVESPTPKAIEGEKNHYNVYLEPNKPAYGKIYVTAPQGGRLQVIPEGDVSAFKVSPLEIGIDPTKNGGCIDITIDHNYDYPGVPTGKSITLSFKALMPDREGEVSGASECIDQVYHFIL